MSLPLGPPRVQGKQTVCTVDSTKDPACGEHCRHMGRLQERKDTPHPIPNHEEHTNRMKITNECKYNQVAKTTHKYNQWTVTQRHSRKGSHWPKRSWQETLFDNATLGAKQENKWTDRALSPASQWQGDLGQVP